MKQYKPHTFTTPKGYFDDFYNRLMDRMKPEVSHTTSSIVPKFDGFVVPQGYFEKFPKKIKTQKSRSSKLLYLKTHKTLYYSAAAVAVLLLLIFGLTWNQKPTVTFDTLAYTELEAYLETHASEIDAYEIAEVVAINPTAWNSMPEIDIQEAELWHYISENIEDLNIEYYEYP